MPNQSISSAFGDRARATPDEIVVVDDAGSTSAAELDRRATQLARVLLRQGVRRNDLVVVALPNSTAFVIACVAIWRVGATPMPINPSMSPAERSELELLAKPVAVCGVPSGHDWIPTVEQSGAHLESTDELPDLWADCWKVTVTSGSTGRPKVVVATAPALVDTTLPMAPIIPKSATQLVASPLWHAIGFTYALRGLMTGHQLVIMPGFDERRFLESVPHHRITWAALSPSSIHRLMRITAADRAAYDVSSLTSILHIGGRCAGADKRALLNWLGPERVWEVYAGSESNGITAANGADWLAHPGTVGVPVDGTRISIRNDDGTEAATGDIGVIWMNRGSRPFYHYLGSRSQRTSDGWDTLDDLGYVDEGGRLYVVDRTVDVIAQGASTIYPADIEELVEEHPQIRGAVAFGERQPDGNDTLALLVDVGDSRITARSVADHLHQRTRGRTTPTRIILTNSHIRDDGGKFRRRTLAEADRLLSAPTASGHRTVRPSPPSSPAG